MCFFSMFRYVMGTLGFIRLLQKMLSQRQQSVGYNFFYSGDWPCYDRTTFLR